MITVKRLHAELSRIMKENINGGDLPLIYSHDDEGNEYQKVHQLAVEAQVHNIKDDYVELVGFFSGDESVTREDINCVIIN